MQRLHPTLENFIAMFVSFTNHHGEKSEQCEDGATGCICDQMSWPLSLTNTYLLNRQIYFVTKDK